MWGKLELQYPIRLLFIYLFIWYKKIPRTANSYVFLWFKAPCIAISPLLPVKEGMSDMIL